MSAIISLPMWIIMGIFPKFFLSIFTSDPHLITEATPTYYVMLGSLLLYLPGLVFFYAVLGTGNTKKSLKIGIISVIIYMIYLFFLKLTNAQLAVCWTADYVYAGFMLIYSYIYMKKGKWKDKNI